MIKINNSNNFDIFRLLLAILVFFAHWNILTKQNITNQLFHLSGYAVDMFFIVSGFLIFWSFDADQNKKHFYIKRFFRIFPLYAFLIVLQTLFFIGFSSASFIELAKYFVSNIFFLNFLAPSVNATLSNLEVNAINGSLWTLKNEILFYLIVPTIFILYKRFGAYFLLGLYFISVSYMFLVDYLGITKLLVQFPAQLRLFLVGIMLYIFFNKFNKNNIYFLASISLLCLFFNESNYFKFTLYPLCIGFIVIYIVYYSKYIKINFDFSYSFYILHFPVIQLFLYFGVNPDNPLISFIVLFSIILVLSYISEKYIEKRFIQIGKNIIKKDKNASN